MKYLVQDDVFERLVFYERDVYEWNIYKRMVSKRKSYERSVFNKMFMRKIFLKVFFLSVKDVFYNIQLQSSALPTELRSVVRKIFLKVSFAKECFIKNTIHLNVHSSVEDDGNSASNK
jgi:hypothetical protein